MRRRVLAAWVAMLFCRVTLNAQSDPAALQARLHTADALTALDEAGLQPWHLKLTVQLFDAKGEATDTGTIEDRWAGPGMRRVDYAFTSYTAAEIWRDGKHYRTTGPGSPPYLLERLQTEAVHPMPKSAEVDGAKPELRVVPFGTVKLDCLMLTQPIKGSVQLPLGLFPTYCFDPGKDVLRASFEYGTEGVIRNAIKFFQHKAVAYKVSVLVENKAVATSEVVQLAEEASGDSYFEVPPDMFEVRGPTKFERFDRSGSAD